MSLALSAAMLVSGFAGVESFFNTAEAINNTPSITVDMADEKHSVVHGAAGFLKCEADGNTLTYEYSASENISNYNVYTAIYNGDGVLLKLIKNQLSGSIGKSYDMGKRYDISCE